ncbi:hypothetical protein jhhlp_004585 [Lomentospora prolificans]|uniref:MaoC-like domain-containing protein n=1 Tax=Lomentospora prolificans TaxID=41688 RepID=A0A2N3NC78_9PEZI|nr:hypothetical protein jhhlp_004585 [Lomentospora prolificans]
MASSIQQFITTAKARPPKLIRDYLSPTNSHLLSLLLADILPQSCYPYPLSSASPNPTNSTGPSPHLAGSTSLPRLPNSPPWGKPLPLGHHLVYFPLQARPSELAWDGADNDHAPGAPYVKRMWAGGKMTFREGWEDVLKVDGRPVVGFEEIGDARVVERGGEGNGMVVMDLKRGYGVEGEGGVAIEEVRRLVFLQGDGAKKAPMMEPTANNTKAKEKPDYSVSLTPSPSLLFSFSALTYNAHRIHIDPEYARSENHRAMLFHGPFSVVVLLTVLNSQLARGEVVEVYDYRNFRPLYVDEKLTVCVRRVSGTANPGGKGSWDIWIEGADGGISVRGTVTTAFREAGPKL